MACARHRNTVELCRDCARSARRRHRPRKARPPAGVSAKMWAWATAKAEAENTSVRAILKQTLEPQKPMPVPTRVYKAIPSKPLPPKSNSVNAPPIGAEMVMWGFASHQNGPRYLEQQNEAFAKAMRAAGVPQRVVGPE